MILRSVYSPIPLKLPKLTTTTVTVSEESWKGSTRTHTSLPPHHYFNTHHMSPLPHTPKQRLSTESLHRPTRISPRHTRAELSMKPTIPTKANYGPTCLGLTRKASTLRTLAHSRTTDTCTRRPKTPADHGRPIRRLGIALGAWPLSLRSTCCCALLEGPSSCIGCWDRLLFARGAVRHCYTLPIWRLKYDNYYLQSAIGGVSIIFMMEAEDSERKSSDSYMSHQFILTTPQRLSF